MIKRTSLEHDSAAKRKHSSNRDHASHSFRKCFSSTAQKICSTASTAAGLREGISNEEGVGGGVWEEKATILFLYWLFFMQLICTMKEKNLEDVTKIVHQLFARKFLRLLALLAVLVAGNRAS